MDMQFIFFIGNAKLKYSGVENFDVVQRPFSVSSG